MSAAGKTWVNFKNHFTQTHRGLKMIQSVSRQAGCNVLEDEINDNSTDITDIVKSIANTATTQ